MENKQIYCIFCGAENKTTDSFCHSCGQSMKQQETELQDYLKNKVTDKIKDTVKDKATDSILDTLAKFLNSKMYGILMSLSIVAATTTAFADSGPDNNATKFSSDIRGQFIDGSMHLPEQTIVEVQAPTTDAVYKGRFDIYPTDSSLTEFYIESSYRSANVGLKVTSGNKTLLEFSSDEASTSKTYTIKGKNPEFYMSYEYKSPDGSYTLNEETVKINSSFGTSYLEEKIDGVQVLLEEYSAYDILSHRIARSAYEEDENGAPMYDMTEQFYDNKGRELSRQYTNWLGEKTSREEYEYDDVNGTKSRLYSEYGVPISYNLHSIDDRLLEDISYIDGEIMSRTTYEYYPSGNILAENYYEYGDASYLRTEFREDGNFKSYTAYDANGNVTHQTLFDENGYQIDNGE